MPSTYAVPLAYTEVDFGTPQAVQGQPGIPATLRTGNVQPALYYRYQIQSQVNGNYVLMPNPPKVYTIRRVPFYKTDGDAVKVHITLQNAGTNVVRTGQAVCAFDLNGKTALSIPLGTSDILPGHGVTAEVDGPAVEAFQTASEGVMTVWVYGLGDDKDRVLRWDIPYQLKEEQRQATGEVMGQTHSEAEAMSYENRIDRAAPDDGSSGN